MTDLYSTCAIIESKTIMGFPVARFGRLEITIKDDGEEREFDITAWWHPQGFPGLLYWFAMMPAHLFIFKGMVKAIAKEAEVLESQSKAQPDG